MAQKNKLKFLLLLSIVVCIILGGDIYRAQSFSSTLMFGHDSNPLRLSKNEIEELPEKPYLLGDASEIYSRFLGASGKFSFYSGKAILARLFKRKTNFSLGYTYKHFNQNEEKNSSYISFKINQVLGNYKYLHMYLIQK